ncbi:MAG: hypothetical protein ABSE82_14810 [Nitrososphaerales archaeon]|jgi:hypothetical protein
MKNGAISKVISIAIAGILIALVILGIYLTYSMSGHTSSTTTNTKASDNISLGGFSIDALTSNVSGTVLVNSRSTLVQMDLYINGTLMGSLNYTGMMTSANYSMMYSASPKSMPIMSTMLMVAGRSYMVTMIALFTDGTMCNASSIVVAEEMMTTGNMMSSSSQNMMSSTGMMSSSNMMSSSSNNMMTTTQMMNTTSNMMGH